MKIIICAVSPERGAVVAQEFAGTPGAVPVTVSTLEQSAAVVMALGDVVVIDNVAGNAFWQVPQWPYILQNIRTVNALAGQDWHPRFT